MKLGSAVKGDKGKRIQAMKEKIIEDCQLYEEDEQEEIEDERFEDLGSEDEEHHIGPRGEIYPSSSEEEGEEGPIYIPRCKVQAYKQAEG